MTCDEITAMADPYELLEQITTGTWSGFTTYRCPCCAYDSTNQAATTGHVHGHIRGALALREQEQQPPVALFGADGRPIGKGA